ncbi:hypothetical protein BQ8794_130316 [Mesorhizobium prunaredense]|uniref:Uncharacterized protein n=1 Tax=Mesorhizobium prunaredense TaxID=1631249 RepID=A0A1R3V1P9_9HYPH|nr:hypothetical protein BQ8794_130316 [Mesorhizobium prunaredense]
MDRRVFCAVPSELSYALVAHTPNSKDRCVVPPIEPTETALRRSSIHLGLDCRRGFYPGLSLNES